MKAIDYIFAVLLALSPALAAAQVRTGQYDDPKSSTGTHSDLEVGVGNGENTTFNKFRKEHWKDVRIPDPKLAEKKKLRDEVNKVRERKYGTDISAPNGQRRPANSKNVGGASKNRGSGYKSRRHGGYDRERDERLKNRAMEKADRDHQPVRDLYGTVQGVIAGDAAFDTPTDGAAMAKAAKDGCSEMPEAPKGPKADLLGDIVDFSQPQYDYEELLRRFVADPNSLTKDELDFLRRKMDEDIKAMEDGEYEELEKAVKNNQNK